MLKKILQRCSVLFFLPFLIIAAFAAGGIDLDRDSTLTLEYKYEGKAISGAAFDLYRVADISSDPIFQLSGDFKEYPVELNSGEWKGVPETLVGYVQRDKLTPIDSGKTDQNGKLTFPTEGELKTGLYLIVGEKFVNGRYTYTTEPFLISLPTRDQENHTWDYDITAYPKAEEEYKPGSGSSSTSRKVLKVWKDTDHENDRPKEVVVQLLRDGEVYDTVTLNEKNNWRHEWTNLSKNHEWTIVEKELDGYTVVVTKEGTTFVVTNTFDEPDEPDEPDQPDEPDEPGTPDEPDEPGKPHEPDQPGSPEEPGKPGTPDQPRLPQTGMLWWPVPLLTVLGLLLFAAGFVLYRKKDHE